MTAFAKSAGRGGGTSGSVMVLALVAAVVASMLAVAASAMLRSSMARAGDARTRRDCEREAVRRILDFAEDAILCDSNSFDAVCERWRNPDDGDDAGGGVSPAVLVPEFPDADAAACADEESRIPLNGGTETPLAALLEALTGKPRELCAKTAAEIAALRPLRRREFIMLAPSLGPDEYRLVAPFVTAAPTAAVNVNTAPRPVLEAMFEAAGRFGTGAPRSLARKLLDFRASGGYLESLDAASVDSALGGLNQAEMEILLSVSAYATVKSRHFSGAAECGGARVVYTIDRETGGLARIAIR